MGWRTCCLSFLLLPQQRQTQRCQIFCMFSATVSRLFPFLLRRGRGRLPAFTLTRTPLPKDPFPPLFTIKSSHMPWERTLAKIKKGGALLWFLREQGREKPNGGKSEDRRLSVFAREVTREYVGGTPVASCILCPSTAFSQEVCDDLSPLLRTWTERTEDSYLVGLTPLVSLPPICGPGSGWNHGFPFFPVSPCARGTDDTNCAPGVDGTCFPSVNACGETETTSKTPAPLPTVWWIREGQTKQRTCETCGARARISLIGI
mmetsp:Transcript_43311/g.112593  ORF Transcript_43311/g.112593 Transcript_43311/m.112593 type:complete len:261 (-) Transcript_43311:1278-2060(-)